MKKYLPLLAVLVAAFSFNSVAASPANTYCSADGGVTWLPCNPPGGGSGGTASQVQGNTGSGTADVGNPVKTGAVFNSTLPTVTNGQRVDTQATARGATLVGIMDGTGQTTGVQAGSPADAQAASNGLFVVSRTTVRNASSWDMARSIVGATGGAGLGVAAVSVVPTSSANQGIAVTRTTTASANLTGKSGAGNFYGFSGAATVTGFFIVYDATAAPADGTVTPMLCYAYPTANSPISVSFGNFPATFTTGLTVGFSTTGCYTKTASSTAFIAIQTE